MRPAVLACLFAAFSAPALAQPSEDTVYRLKSSIVKIHTITKSGGHGVGSGVVVAKDIVATNCHVLADADGVNVAAYGETYRPDAVREDWHHDVCLLRVNYLPLTPAELGDSEHLQYEQPVFSIGFSGGPAKPLTLDGNIKALYPLDDSFVIRTSYSFMLGASGSAIFDNQGKLIGLNTVKSPGRPPHAYYYGVPVKWVKKLLKAPESSRIGNPGTPFWDAPESSWPFFMQVVGPSLNDKWADLKTIAEGWISAEPANAEAHYYLGLAQQRLGDNADALKEYTQAVNLNSRHAEALKGLAALAQQAGDQREVQRLSMQIRELDASDEFQTAP